MSIPLGNLDEKKNRDFSKISKSRDVPDVPRDKYTPRDIRIQSNKSNLNGTWITLSRPVRDLH